MPGFEIKIAPMGAVRMTQRSKFKDSSAQRYLQYKKVIGWEAKKHFPEPLTGPVEVIVIFHMPEPKKMPKGRTHPVVKPDIDNMIKGVFDSLNKIAWEDDNQIVKITSGKYYASEPLIEITVHSA